MRSFLEFARDNERGDVRQMVLTAIGANPNAPGVEEASLSDYDDFKKKILNHNGLLAKIRDNNEGAVLQILDRAEQDSNITVGQLINMIVTPEV